MIIKQKMSLSGILNWRLTWWSLIIFCNYCGIYSANVNNGCIMPETSPQKPVLIYQQSQKVKTIVWHCSYEEIKTCNQEICANCQTDFNETLRENTTSYSSYIGEDCLKHFNVTVKNATYSASYNCSNGTILTKTASVKLTSYETEADIGLDRIILKSHTECKYTYGFCHDDKEDVDVFWKVTDVSDKSTFCNYLKRVDGVFSYYFNLKKAKHVIIETGDKYYVLTLQNQSRCNYNQTIWKTNIPNVMISEDIINGTSGIYKGYDTLGISFEKKQSVYDYLLQTCYANQSITKLAEKLTIASIKLTEQEDSTWKLRSELQWMHFKSDIFLYISVCASALCLVIIVLFLIYYVCKERPVELKEVAAGSSKPELNTNTDDNVTTEYQEVMNEVYGKILESHK